jgi:hypothetical protein
MITDDMVAGMYVDAARAVGFEITRVLPEFGLNFRVRHLDDQREVWLLRMLTNWRVQETFSEGQPAGRYWCYAGLGMATFMRALRHAACYGDGEPDGWVRAHDGRRGGSVGARDVTRSLSTGYAGWYANKPTC